MYRFSLALAVPAMLFATDLPTAVAQVRGTRLQGIINLQDAKISEQRVQRQTEILRLERELFEFKDRVTRLERQLLSMSRIPAITIAEAQAQVDFAEAQLKEREYLAERGEASEVEVARDRLALIRARGQLESATSAHAESEIMAELDVAYAERRLLTASNEKEQMERMVAKGYTSSEGLRYQIIDVDLAEKQLRLARLRLESQRKAAGKTDDPPGQSPASQ